VPGHPSIRVNAKDPRGEQTLVRVSGNGVGRMGSKGGKLCRVQMNSEVSHVSLSEYECCADAGERLCCPDVGQQLVPPLLRQNREEL